MLTVACVLKTGGEYNPGHVRALRDDIREHVKVPYRFVCLSDLPGKGYDVIRLRHDWRGWFSKIELFSGVLTGPVFYLDLDTRIVGPIDDMVTGHRFTVLENFHSPARIGSGLMAWDADLTEIYRVFLTNPAAFMAEYVTTERWGDQGFIKFNSPIEPERWQSKHPGRVVSARLIEKSGVPAGASIVCYGGPRRPWTMDLAGVKPRASRQLTVCWMPEGARP